LTILKKYVRIHPQLKLFDRVNYVEELMMPAKIGIFLSVIKSHLAPVSKELDRVRRSVAKISYLDAFMSGLAVFVLKHSSLLQYDNERCAGNLKNLFGIALAPSDTRMREMLDKVDPKV
jgi:hypothetical protein